MLNDHPEGGIEIRSPVAADARAVWQMVDGMSDLDSNSPYAYLLLCTHFASTSLVARAGEDLAGFVLGYARPDDASTAFVWQVAVAECARGRGLAHRLLDNWFARCARRSDVRFLEATVTPSNQASRALFTSFANKRGAPLPERVEFPQRCSPKPLPTKTRSPCGSVRFRLHRRSSHDRRVPEPWRSSTVSSPRFGATAAVSPPCSTPARGARLVDQQGRSYVDFFSGAGALNYGHNDPAIKRRLIAYLESDGITHGLDMATTAKEEFLETFAERILEPRGLKYKTQFPGPTGTNAVEAALKLARKVTGREGIVSFTNAFHGMTLGSLAVTGNGFKRRGAGVPLHFGDALPFDGFLGEEMDTLDVLEAMLEDGGSGMDPPAAVIVETTQAEGGLNVASVEWLRRLQDLCRHFGSLLIVDDIQVGIGRTGPFFSFERAGLEPDLVCLSKSLSGYGLPLAIVLIRPELDVWEPGEHNGTFRGNNPAFVTATAALDYWQDDGLSREVAEKSLVLRRALESYTHRHPSLDATVKGIGLIQGLSFEDPKRAAQVSRRAFECGLLLETAGPEGAVAKLMPPLNIDEVSFKDGLEILSRVIDDVAADGDRR